MKKVLFLIHDLGPGGAEKVLVNLANHLDKQKFDITVMSLFAGGVNEKNLKPHIRYITCFKHMIRGNSHFMKLLSPKTLHRWLIKEQYDIEVSYLEGPSARIISGCKNTETKLISWIHVEQCERTVAAKSFRTFRESKQCYERFDKLVYVSEQVKSDMLSLYPTLSKNIVLYNTNDTEQIKKLADEIIEGTIFKENEIRLCGVGKLMQNKGFDKIIRIHHRLLKDGFPVHTYILGDGPEKEKLISYISEHHLEDSITLLGYQDNPYKYVANCDILLCASTAEGFSTAATEALIVGTAVCTVAVAGMKEMLDDEYGIITENDEDALYEGIKRLLDAPALLAHYKAKAAERGKMFSTEATVKVVEEMLLSL